MPQCLNCSAELNGRFCAECGQKASTTRFSIIEILHEFGPAFLHADKGIFAYVLQLLRRPGQLAQEFVVAGKRKRYFSPFVYFLVILTLHGLLQKNLLLKLESIFHWNDAYAASIIVSKKLFTVVTVLIWALLLKCIFPRALRFAEFVVVAMVFVSGIETIETLLDLFVYAWLGWGKTYFSVTNSITLLFYWVYFGWAIGKFFSPSPTAFWQKALAGFASILSLLLSLVLFVLVLNNFKGLGMLSFYGMGISSTPIYD